MQNDYDDVILRQRLWACLGRIPGGYQLVHMTAKRAGLSSEIVDASAKRQKVYLAPRPNVTQQECRLPTRIAAELRGLDQSRDGTAEPSCMIENAASWAVDGWLEESTLCSMVEEVKHLSKVYPICRWRNLVDNRSAQWRVRSILSQAAARVLVATVRRALQIHDWLRRIQRRPRTVAPTVAEWRILSFNPGRSGLFSLRTGSVLTSKVFGVNGLLPFAHRRRLDAIALPAAMLPDGFQLRPVVLWICEQRGGTRAASCALWRRGDSGAEMTQIARPTCSTHPTRGIPNVVTLEKTAFVFVISYLKTAGGKLNDKEWVEQVRETANFIAEEVASRGLHGWLWLGEFNY